MRITAASFSGSFPLPDRPTAVHVDDFQEEGYLLDDDEEEVSTGTGSVEGGAAGAGDQESEEEADPLDFLMASYNEQAKEDLQRMAKEERAGKAIRLDDLNDKEEYDAEQAHLVTEAKYDDEKEVEYDEDGNPIIKKRAGIPLLTPLNASEMNFAHFEKNFYTQHTEVTLVAPQRIAQWLSENDIRIQMPYQMEALRPVWEFRQFNLNPLLTIAISQAGFQSPTPIQSVALPVSLSGYDLIATAKTGSGKTMAFVWPMIQHILGQEYHFFSLPDGHAFSLLSSLFPLPSSRRGLAQGEGPIGVILSPTRELADQTMKETARFASVFHLDVKSIMGGLGKWEQKKALHNQPDIIIATPGRLIDMLKMKATNMRRCTILVLDEADRMFDLGFEPQIRSIIGQIRPERQTLLFSATFHRRVEALAREVLINPVRITIGNSNQSNTDVQQIVEILKKKDDKWNWLNEHIYHFSNEGKVLIFVSTKENASELSARIQKECRLLSDAIHGDKHQSDRNTIMNRFKKDHIHILVATDLASRGLDVEGIQTVINYDPPKNIETHIHRVGRTSRMGRQGIIPGTAYTLLTPGDSSFAGELIYNLQRSKQAISQDLLNLAARNPRFHPPRFLGASSGQFSSSSQYTLRMEPQAAEAVESLQQRREFRQRGEREREQMEGVSRAALQSAESLQFMAPSAPSPQAPGYQTYQIPSRETRRAPIGGAPKGDSQEDASEWRQGQGMAAEHPSSAVGSFVRSRQSGSSAGEEERAGFAISAPKVEPPKQTSMSMSMSMSMATATAVRRAPVAVAAQRRSHSSPRRHRSRSSSSSSSTGSSSSSASRSRSRSHHRHRYRSRRRHH